MSLQPYGIPNRVSATSRVLGRKTAGAGVVEECTLSDILDFLGSTQGDVLYRGASGWAKAGAGTAGQVWQTGGAGANPSWVTGNKLVQRNYAEYTTSTALSTTIPADDTIPQNTEGTEILTASITPTSASNRVRARFMGWGACPSGTVISAALFRDSTADALCAYSIQGWGTDFRQPVFLELEHAPSTTSATTYKVRVGPNSGTMYLNGTSGGRTFGGVSRVTLIVEEIAP